MLTDKVKERVLAKLINNNFDFSFKSLKLFFEKHTYFVENFNQEIRDYVINHSVEKPSAPAVSFLYEQYARAIELVSGIKGEFYDGQLLSIADLIVSLYDSYRTLMSALILQGLNDEQGFEVNLKYREYVIDKNTSLDDIARDQLGSVEFLEDLLVANPWIANLSREELLGKTILIPDQSTQKNALTVNIGKKSWGKDLPDTLEILQGDLTVLDEEDTLEQTVFHIIKYMRKSVPEDPNIGNPIIELIGEDTLSVDEILKARMLQDILEADPSIESALVTDVKAITDKASATIYIKPVNSEEVKSFEL